MSNAAASRRAREKAKAEHRCTRCRTREARDEINPKTGLRYTHCPGCAKVVADAVAALRSATKGPTT